MGIHCHASEIVIGWAKRQGVGPGRKADLDIHVN